MEGDCKIAEKLDLAHKWAHRVTEQLRPDELLIVHALGEKILELLNDSELSNGIKFLALVEILSVGADELEYHGEIRDEDEQGTVTVN